MNTSWRKGIPGRGNSKYKVQEVGAFWTRSWWVWSRGIERGEAVREEGEGM